MFCELYCAANPRLEDGSPAWIPAEEKENGEKERPPQENNAEGEPEREMSWTGPVTSGPAAIQPDSEVLQDSRGALEKARCLLEGGEDAARRVKLLRDMLGGRLIDESGRPLPI